MNEWNGWMKIVPCGKSTSYFAVLKSCFNGTLIKKRRRGEQGMVFVDL